MAMADVVQQLVQLGADGAVLPRRWFNELYGAASEDADDNAGGVLPPASRALMALVQRGSSTGFDGPGTSNAAGSYVVFLIIVAFL